MRAKARVLGGMLEGVLVLVLVLVLVDVDVGGVVLVVVVVGSVVVGSGSGVFVDGASVVAGSVVGAGAGAASAHGVCCCGVVVDPVSMGVVSDGEELSYIIPLLVAVESRMFRGTIPDVAGPCSVAGSISMISEEP